MCQLQCQHHRDSDTCFPRGGILTPPSPGGAVIGSRVSRPTLPQVLAQALGGLQLMSQPDSLAQGQLTVPGDVNNCPGLAVHPFLHVFLTQKWPIGAEQCCPPPVSGIWPLVPGRGQDLLTSLMASKVWALDSCVGAGVVQGGSGGGGAALLLTPSV